MTTAEAKLVFEVRCPECGSWNKYHDLSAAHGNLRRRLQCQIDGTGAPIEAPVKCTMCNKPFDIDRIKLA